MKKSWPLRALFAGAAATSLVACAAITGVGDLSVDEESTPDAADAARGTGDVSAPPSPTATTTATGTSMPEPPPPGAGDDASPPSAQDSGDAAVSKADAADAADAGSARDADASVVPPADAAPEACSPAGCETVPVGFAVVALGAQGAACPGGFGGAIDGVEQPTVDPSACTCGGCNVGQQPSCAIAAATPGGGTMTLLYGPYRGGACPSTGQAVPTGCSTAGFLGPFLDYDRSYSAPPATLTGGSCNAPIVVQDNTRLKAVAGRMCTAQAAFPQCQGKTCVPSAGAFSVCVAASGSVTCPAGWPQRHVVGTSASFTCSAGCTCTLDGKCGTTGSLSYFSSTDCSGAAGFTYPVGGCNPTAGSAATYGSHRYDPDGPTAVQCVSGGSTTPSAPTLAQQTTVCCR